MWDVANTLTSSAPVAHHLLADCVKDYSNIPVRKVDGSLVADPADKEGDAVSAELLGQGSLGEKIYKLSESCCFDKIGGTIIVSVMQNFAVYDVASFDMSLIYYGEYRAQGGMSKVTVIPGNGVLVDVSFDDSWVSIPDGELSRLPPMGIGCPRCGLGTAHVMVSFDGKTSRVNSIDVFEPYGPTEYSCNQIAMKKLVKTFPHTFSREEMLRLGGEIRKACPS